MLDFCRLLLGFGFVVGLLLFGLGFWGFACGLGFASLLRVGII